MSRGWFWFANVVSALVWAPMLLFAGDAVGDIETGWIGSAITFILVFGGLLHFFGVAGVVWAVVRPPVHRPDGGNSGQIASSPDSRWCSVEAFLVSTLVVGLAEIGDKTQILSLMLAARFQRPVPIIVGIFFATIANHAVAGAWPGRISAASSAAHRCAGYSGCRC